jgi:hypothetical protein
VAIEEPVVGRDIELADDMALAERATVRADLGDAIHHQHRRCRQLRIARAEIAAFARSQQLVPGVGWLRRVEIVGVGHGDKTFAGSGAGGQLADVVHHGIMSSGGAVGSA